jgi:2-phospho-L-lactate guanylyltransferase
MIVVAVPVKDLANVKQRLVPVLSGAERAALARTMLADVLRALAVARVGEVWVVTRDAAVSAIADAGGARVVVEGANRGHTAAVKTAQDAAVAAGATGFVTVPGDVPCVRPAEIAALAARIAGKDRAVAFAPSRSGLGTNGAAMAPPDLLPLRFGEPSFPDHLEAARARRLRPHVLALPGLALDIDDADDLRALLVDGPATDSARLLRGWSLSERLAVARARA